MASGLAFHVHHNRLIEWCWNFEERVKYIKENKPLEEQEIRLRLFRLIPPDTLPANLQKAEAERDKADAERDKADAKRNKAYAEWEKAYAEWRKTDADLDSLHAELCPNCPWDGETIFPKEKGA